MDSFNYNKIKGSIAKELVAGLLQNSNYMVYSFGYESLLSQFHHDFRYGGGESPSARRLRSMPDLLVYDRDSKQPYFCEVKYRSQKVSEVALPVEDLRSYQTYWHDSILALVVPTEHIFYAQFVDKLNVDAHINSRNQIFNISESFRRIDQIFTKVTTDRLSEYKEYLSRFRSMNGESSNKLNIMLKRTVNFQLEDQA